MPSYDIVGDIAIVKFDKEKKKDKVKFARELLERPNVKVVLEKADRIKGRLRTAKMDYIAGEKRKDTLYKENGCSFRLNVETCYFSSRLSEERKLIAAKIDKTDRVLVMFAGVAPFSIIIAKFSKCKEVVSVEISRECSKYAEQNVRINKLGNVRVIQGDVKKKLAGLGKFTKIVMARPNLKETFLKYALDVSKKGTIVYYYGFSHIDHKDEMVKELKKEAEKLGRKIVIKEVVRAGDIAPYKFRYRIEIKIL
jgi:tRNA (guanine37-N1)-methyltransferase